MTAVVISALNFFKTPSLGIVSKFTRSFSFLCTPLALVWNLSLSPSLLCLQRCSLLQAGGGRWRATAPLTHL